MKFRLVSSNSRGLPINKSKLKFEMDVISKMDCSFILLLTHETCFQSCLRRIVEGEGIFLLHYVSSDGVLK